MLTLNNDSASAAKTEQNAHLLPGLEWFALTDTQLDAYFARVGLDSVFSSANKPPATFETLKTLVKAHTTSVPFDNITRRILIGDRHELKTGGDGLYRKIVERKRGGLCFEQNTFFRAVLAAIGFRVFRRHQQR
ncbi:cysteine proteinase [Ramicandelaber brevisporus]|nr:cysteine proteinase [Ramicandelaber brevisporus]